MGEIDITTVHSDLGMVIGVRYAFLTVFFTWLPLAIAGIVLARRRVVHATMRGADPIAAISAAGIVAWHRVLAALASREGDGRMLV